MIGYRPGGGTYELYRGDALLGRIVHTEDDMPWHLGTFEPAPGFEAVHALFAREAALLHGGTDQPEWQAVRADIDAPGLRLLEGHRVVQDAPLLHIEGGRAWWR